MDLYYVEEKDLDNHPSFPDIICTTGSKTITVYDIDTQYMGLIIFCEIESTNEKNSEEEIQFWLDNNGHKKEYNFVRL